MTYPGPPRPAQVSAHTPRGAGRSAGHRAPAGRSAAARSRASPTTRAPCAPATCTPPCPAPASTAPTSPPQAAGLGAVAVLTDPAGAERAAATGLPVLVVDDPRAPDGRAGRRDLRPTRARDLLQIGITGTSGKTTTAYLVEGGLRGAGRAAPA